MATPVATPITGGIKKEKKKPERRVRSGVEAATSRVMNLIGRLPEGEQRKVVATITALVSKAD